MLRTSLSLLAGALLSCSSSEERFREALHEWQELSAQYERVCTTGNVLGSMWAGHMEGPGPKLLCTRPDRPLPTLIRGRNASAVGRMLLSAGEQSARLDEATALLHDASHELRSGARGWLADDMLIVPPEEHL